MTFHLLVNQNITECSFFLLEFVDLMCFENSHSTSDDMRAVLSCDFRLQLTWLLVETK